MSGKIVQSTKFFAILQETEDMDYQKFKSIFFELQRAVRTYKNNASSLYFVRLQEDIAYHDANGEWPTNEAMGRDGGAYWFSKEMRHSRFADCLSALNSGCCDTIGVSVQKKMKTMRKDLIAGNVTAPTFKQNQPIEFRKQEITLYERGGKQFIQVSFLSNGGKKQYGVKYGRLSFEVWHKSDSGLQIVKRCISGEYQHATASLNYSGDKRMFEFSLQYSMDSPSITLDKDKILGIDLGVALPVAMAVGGEKTRYFIRGGEVEHFRKVTEAKRREMLRSRVYCGDGSIGHGTLTRIRPTERLGNHIANFRDTKNGAWSREIVNIAIKNGCGTIQMEDLSGIKKSESPMFLKNWTYFDLQEKVSYKAKAAGIEVVKVDPRYTSQRCSCCGYIDAGNRLTQAEFKCLNCGYEENADYNAARNIATKDIEKLIALQCEAQAHSESA